MNRRKTFLGAAALAASMVGPRVAAQSDRPLSLVVGYSAGGSADFVARVLAEAMARRLGRQVIVENVAGASGMLAAQKVVGAPADGALIYMGGTDTVLIPMVNAKVKLDWERDLLPVGRMTTLPMVFAVPAASPHQSLADLLGALRRGGKPFNYAIPGIGTMQHLYGALITQRAQVEMTHVPYRGGAQIANDLVGGQVDAAVLVLSTAMPFLKDGKIRAISVSDASRVPQLPQVRRLGEEAGFDGLALPLWQGLFVKAGTPAATLAAYERALLEAVGQPEVRAKLADAGITPSALPGSELRSFVAQQSTLYREIVKAARISME